MIKFKKFKKILKPFFVSIIVLGFLLSNLAFAGGVVISSENNPVNINQEKVIIIYNEEKKEETILISLKVDNRGKFGYLVPVKGETKIDGSSTFNNLFTNLEKYTRPKVNYLNKIRDWNKKNYDNFWSLKFRNKNKNKSSNNSNDSSRRNINNLRLMAQKEIIKDADELNQWKEKNNFVIPVKVNEEINNYFANNYQLAAFIFNSYGFLNYFGYSTPTVKITFASDKIVYPFKLNYLNQYSDYQITGPFALPEFRADKLPKFNLPEKLLNKRNKRQKEKSEVIIYLFADSKKEIEQKSIKDYCTISYAEHLSKNELTNDLLKHQSLEINQDYYLTKFSIRGDSSKFVEDLTFKNASDNNPVNSSKLTGGQKLLIPFYLIWYKLLINPFLWFILTILVFVLFFLKKQIKVKFLEWVYKILQIYVLISTSLIFIKITSVVVLGINKLGLILDKFLYWLVFLIILVVNIFITIKEFKPSIRNKEELKKKNNKKVVKRKSTSKKKK